MAKNGTQRTERQRFKNITHVLLPVVSYRCLQTLCGSLGSDRWMHPIENSIKTMYLELLVNSVPGARVSPSRIFMAQKIHTDALINAPQRFIVILSDPVHFLWSEVRNSTLD